MDTFIQLLARALMMNGVSAPHNGRRVILAVQVHPVHKFAEPIAAALTTRVGFSLDASILQSTDVISNSLGFSIESVSMLPRGPVSADGASAHRQASLLALSPGLDHRHRS